MTPTTLTDREFAEAARAVESVGALESREHRHSSHDARERWPSVAASLKLPPSLEFCQEWALYGLYVRALVPHSPQTHAALAAERPIHDREAGVWPPFPLPPTRRP